MIVRRLFISVCLLFFAFHLTVAQSGVNDNYENAVKFKSINTDSALYYFQKNLEISIQKKDTLSIINTLINQSDLYAHRVNYVRSYEGYWEALLLADKTKDSVSISKIYRGLGWLYSFYKRDKEALKYFNLSIEINNKLIKNNKETEKSNINNYYSLVNLCRMNKDFEKARVYLDSSRSINNPKKLAPDGPYLTVEAAYLEAMNAEYDSALKKINLAIDHFQKSNPAYLIVIHALLGEIYTKMNQIEKSIEHYNISLNLLDTYNMHLNYRGVLYESLSDLYARKKNVEKAYFYLKKAKEENDLVFGSRSEYNQHLLEIKDKYRIAKDSEQQFLNEKRIEQLEYEDKVNVLKTTLLIAGIVFTILFSYLFFRYLRNNYKREKIVLQEKQKLRLHEEKLKLEKQAEVLEIKNKELTESALRLIEKDEFIDGVEKMISSKNEPFNVNKLKLAIKNIRINSNSNWEEFEARFIAVNQSFYDKLNAEYPQLTQTDQKICALVKLNLPSKQMAKLLGISVESVHSSRYRLRKKLGLDRNDNLEEFINTL